MREFERKQLLEHIEREGATVGASIPERITVQDEEVNLREFVFEMKRRDTMPSGEREKVHQAKKNLRRERLQRKQRIEDDEISYEEGRELARSIVGLDRALNALRSLEEPTDVQAEAEAKEAADQKRWTRFLRQVLGQNDTGPRTGLGP